MPNEDKKEIGLEIGHVLFIDIVGYSKLLITEQSERLQKLKEIVWGTEQFRQAQAEGKLLRLPTGDGGALVFRNHQEAPVLCAMEIGKELKRHPELQVRMGIHSGPVNEITDLNAQANIAGAGINIAQRVMDCGDAGHILLSQHVADDLEQYPRWRSLLHDLGEREVKHGARIHAVNLYTDELGNPSVPEKFRHTEQNKIATAPVVATPPKTARFPWHEIVIGILFLAALIGGASLWFHRSASRGSLTTEVVIPENSVAVLPFVNMSEEKANEFFSDGISEELLNLLSKIPQLKVAARTSSFSFKGKGVEIPEIARQLHVANVLEGSVRKSGDQLRITAQLIRAAEGYHLWSETYDRKMDDIFKIQDEIAGQVVKELKVKLLGAAPKVRTTDPKAYALFLQARGLGRQFNPEAFTKSDALYRQVLEIDPRYAPALSELARNFNNEATIGMLSTQEGYTRAREAAAKALAIDPDYAPANARLGTLAMYGNDLAGAARHYQRALTLDPTDLDVLRNAATFLLDLGRRDDALALKEAVARRDPVNVLALFDLGYYERMTGRFDVAIASLRTVLSLSPGNGGAHCQLGVALLLKADVTAALTEIEQEKSEVWRMLGLPMAYCALGRRADADAALNALIAKYEKDWSYQIAYVYAFCGDADKAFEWLDKAVTYQDPGLSEIVPENLFDKIHSDPRWLPFLRKIGRAPDQLAKIEFKVPPLPQ
jgi:TolB-like protein/class 3 adenylate cyclase/Flp pilus assembly protein TadD